MVSFLRSGVPQSNWLADDQFLSQERFIRAAHQYSVRSWRPWRKGEVGRFPHVDPGPSGALANECRGRSAPSSATGVHGMGVVLSATSVIGGLPAGAMLIMRSRWVFPQNWDGLDQAYSPGGIRQAVAEPTPIWKMCYLHRESRRPCRDWLRSHAFPSR